MDNTTKEKKRNHLFIASVPTVTPTCLVKSPDITV